MDPGSERTVHGRGFASTPRKTVESSLSWDFSTWLCSFLHRDDDEQGVGDFIVRLM